MSASSKAAERDPLLPYTRQFGSINEDEDETMTGRDSSEEAPHRTTSKTGERRRSSSSTRIRDGASKTKIHASFLYVLMACVLFFSGAIVGSSSSPLSKMILMSKEDGVSSAKGQREINTIGSGRWRRSKTLPVRRLYHQR